MKEGVMCFKAASNQYTLRTDCINKNVKHKAIKNWKAQDLKKGPVGEVTSNQNLSGICIAIRFVL